MLILFYIEVKQLKLFSLNCPKSEPLVPSNIWLYRDPGTGGS